MSQPPLAVVKAIPSSAHHEVKRDLSKWLREFSTDSLILKTHKDGRYNLYNKSTLGAALMDSWQQCAVLQLGNVFGEKLSNEAQTPTLNITVKDFNSIVKCENKKDKRYLSKDLKFDMLVAMRRRLQADRTQRDGWVLPQKPVESLTITYRVMSSDAEILPGHRAGNTNPDHDNLLFQVFPMPPPPPPPPPA
jgi:hypothetical protein